MSVEIRGLTKHYGATPALDDVDLTIRPGQVHALLGHNGAGKSTLIRCLGGGTSPDAGTMTIDGVVHHALDPRQSIVAGVAVIYQHLSLITELSVVDNIFLGAELSSRGRRRTSEQIEQAHAALRRAGASCSPSDRVGDLPIGQRQLVEIAKAMRRRARLLVLDEPTAALSQHEADALADRVLQLKAEGIAILYVTHLLGEVERLADEVTVMRGGRVVWSTTRARVSRRELVQAITGSAAVDRVRPAAPAPTGEGLRVQGLRAPGVGPVDLAVGAGEVVGLHGLMGSGRTRMLETLFGRHRAASGAVSVGGRAVSLSSPRHALRCGISLVPGDRLRQGLFPSMGARDNVLIRASSALARRGVRDRAAERRSFEETAGAVALRPPDPHLPAGAFSGGNQQKILLGRWISQAQQLRVLLLDDPTQGVDVGARQEIYAAVRALAARGVAVLFASSDPEELIALADRALLVAGGRVRGELPLHSRDVDALVHALHAAAPPAPDPATTGDRP